MLFLASEESELGGGKGDDGAEEFIMRCVDLIN